MNFGANFLPCGKCHLSYPRSVLRPVAVIDKRIGQMKQILVCTACIAQLEKESKQKKQQNNEKI
ncbi:MAG: hypothetical protein ACTSQG_02760 [Promethearchaeota archaeon]